MQVPFCTSTDILLQYVQLRVQALSCLLCPSHVVANIHAVEQLVWDSRALLSLNVFVSDSEDFEDTGTEQVHDCYVSPAFGSRGCMKWTARRPLRGWN